MTKHFLNMKREENKGIIDIYGEVVPEGWRFEDETSAMHFKDQMERFEDVEEITLNINSPGGSVYEGVAIYNMLKRHKARVVVNIDGLAASIASVIAMAGDVVRMPSNSMVMIHNAMTMAVGNAEDMRETADLLDKVSGTIMSTYLEKSDQINEATLKALMDAETWLTAEEALHYGLIDEVVTSKELVACASKAQLNMFNKTPDKIFHMVETPEETGDETDETEEMDDAAIKERFDKLEGQIGNITRRLDKLENEEDNTDEEPEPRNSGFKRFLF